MSVQIILALKPNLALSKKAKIVQLVRTLISCVSNENSNFSLGMARRALSATSRRIYDNSVDRMDRKLVTIKKEAIASFNNGNLKSFPVFAKKMLETQMRV